MNGLMWFISGASVGVALFTMLLDVVEGRQIRQHAEDMRTARAILATFASADGATPTADAIDAMYRERVRHDD